MYNKRIVIDFDDTLAFTTDRNWADAAPNVELIEKCNKLHDSGWTIDIFTARGSISCNTRAHAEAKYGPQIREWLVKHNVKYNTLSFDKPLAAYYIDDKGISPELFLDTDIRDLEGGLSGSDIYTDGHLVHKTDKNSHEAAAWLKYAMYHNINVPKVERVVGDTITMEYIPANLTYFENNSYKAIALIQETLEKLESVEEPNKELTFDDYIGRIVGHVNKANVPMFNDIAERLSKLDLQPSFSHGDFSIKNLLFYELTGEAELCLIDPIPSCFGNKQLDIPKFIASLIINEYSYKHQELSMKTLCIYNNLDIKEQWLLVASEIIRVYKYHPNKDFIIQCVNDILPEIE